MPHPGGGEPAWLGPAQAGTRLGQLGPNQIKPEPGRAGQKPGSGKRALIWQTKTGGALAYAPSHGGISRSGSIDLHLHRPSGTGMCGGGDCTRTAELTGWEVRGVESRMEGWNRWIGELRACGHMQSATSGNSTEFLGTPLWNTVAPPPLEFSVL